MKKLIYLIVLIGTVANAKTYTDITPILNTRCATCHNAQAMPDKNWLDYSQAFKAKDKIKDRVFIKKDMPMGNATNITEQERKDIADWVDSGGKR